MGKFDGFLICTDCDGTLTNKDGLLSDENARAIKYFQDEGGKFTLATGRFPQHAYTFKDKLTVNAPVVSLNGVLLYDLEKEEALCNLSMETKASFKVMKYLNENWKGIWEYWLNFSGKESACYKPFEDKFESESLVSEVDFEEFCGMVHENSAISEMKVFEEIQNLLPEKMAKIVFVMPEDMLKPVQKDLRERFGDEFNFDSSWPNGLEMQWVKSGKGIAVEMLKERLGNIHTTVCVGDYDNDISMLKIADISYAVANAIDEVKAVASKVTVSNNDNALEAVIKDLEKRN